METLEVSRKEKHEVDERLREMAVEFKFLLKKVGKELFERPYGLIVGDDPSGRLPALLMYEFLQRVYGKRNLPKPEILFFAGEKYLMDEEVEKRSSKISEHIDRAVKEAGLNNPNTLIVTETVEYGLGLRPITEGIARSGLTHDLFSGTMFYADVPRERELSQAADSIQKITKARKFFYGQIGSSSVKWEYDLSGVIRDNKSAAKGENGKEDKEIFSVPTKEFARTPVDETKIQKSVDKSREDIKILAEELFGWYETWTERGWDDEEN